METSVGQIEQLLSFILSMSTQSSGQ